MIGTAFPSHPERHNFPPAAARPALAGDIVLGTLTAALSGIAGVLATLSTVPAGGKLLESPMLLQSFMALTIICAVASWFAPTAGLYWGVVAGIPYFVAYWGEVSNRETIGANLSPIGFLFLIFLTLMPWVAGFSVGLARLLTRR